MKNREFEVTLTGGHKSIQYAMSERAAIILAQAEAIHDARDFEFVSIREIE